MPGHWPELSQAFEPQRARGLLAEAGYPQGTGCPPIGLLTCLGAEARAACVAAQWEDVLGVEVRWEALPWADYLRRLSKDPPRIIDYTWAADYPDPDSFFRVCRARTFGAWEHEDFDRLVTQARSVTDQGERLDLYRQADEVLVEEVPILPLIYGRRHLLIKPWVRRYPTSAVQSAFWKDAVVESH
jgi:oligopeptide transport system substrate-binding protein